jgi:hypothetical protein
MPSDADRCREHAYECWAWAADTKNRSLKESLIDIGKRWTRLARELEATRILFEQIGRVSNGPRETGPILMTSRPVVWPDAVTEGRNCRSENANRPLIDNLD